MKGSDLGRYSSVFVAAAILVSCNTSGSQAIPNPQAGARVAGQSPSVHGLGSNYRVVYNFRRHGDGNNPNGLTALKGTLYGTTYGGGTSGDGTVFSITKTGTERVLYNFKGHPNGSHPTGNLTEVNSTLYGTTHQGGSGHGTIFSVTSAGKERVLYRFQGGSDGSDPDAGLMAFNGTLYGTTYGGGTSGYGTLFSVTKTGTERVLYNFKGTPDGANPAADVTELDGTIYGTTYNGGSAAGSNAGGTVFGVTMAGKEVMLYSFEGPPSDGANPQAGLTVVAGRLFGTTSSGGSGDCPPASPPYYGCGTVFRITTAGKERVLHAFDASDGIFPSADLTFFKGTLYGTAFNGGRYIYGGTIFSVSPAGKFGLLYSFARSQTDGTGPAAPLTDLNGTLYGTTSGGGTHGVGTVFALTP